MKRLSVTLEPFHDRYLRERSKREGMPVSHLVSRAVRLLISEDIVTGFLEDAAAGAVEPTEPEVVA